MHADELAEDVRAFMDCQNLPTGVMPSVRMFRQAQEDDLLASMGLSYGLKQLAMHMGIRRSTEPAGRINRSYGLKQLARHMGIQCSTEPAGRNLAQVVKDVQAFAQQQGPAETSDHMPRLIDLEKAGKHRLASHVTHYRSHSIARKAGLTLHGRGTLVSDIVGYCTLQEDVSLLLAC